MTTTGTVRGNYAKTAARRRVIVEAGVEVFASGYHSGSIREIAERVGMSQAGLLHHFTNKSALLAAVLEQRDEESRKMVNVDPVDGLETIRGLIALTKYNESIPGLVELFCVLSAESTSVGHPAHQYFVNRYDYTVGITIQAFAMMAERGQLREGVDPASLGKNLIALMDGLQVQWLLNRGSLDMAEQVRDYVQPLLTVEL